MMERPMPALRSLLNVYCRRTAKRKLAAIGLSKETNRLSYKDGRVKLVSQDGEA